MAKEEKLEKAKKTDVKEKTVKKSNKKGDTKKNNTKKKPKVKADKKSLWVRFRIFCHGVKSEFGKVHWPGKKDMIRYSIATIFFVIFCALFFYLINIIFALIQTLFK